MTRQPLEIRHPYSQRLKHLRTTLGAFGVDAVLVTHPPNLRYLCGFDGSLGALIVSAATATLIVDGRYITSARARAEETPELRDVAVEWAQRSLEEAIVQVIQHLPGISRVGVEALAITLARFQRLEHALCDAGSRRPPLLLQPTENVVEQQRVIKDAAEVAVLREAAARLSAVARQALPAVQPGRTEQQVAAEVDRLLRAAGFERPAFETIVASGPNSALPHARPTRREMRPGEGVVLDFGGIYDGYSVDLTRTVQLAPSTVEFRRVFEAVRAAQTAAIRAVAPGVRASQVDYAARTELERFGLGEAFAHGTGHGLGLEVHEDPRLTRPGSSQADHVLRPSMVFTIEPGAYLPGFGGVRIEDDVLVVAAGCEVLTDVPIDPDARAE